MSKQYDDDFPLRFLYQLLDETEGRDSVSRDRVLQALVNAHVTWSEMEKYAEAERIEMLTALRLTLDFYSADTRAFVLKHGAGMTTRNLCDRIRAAIAHAEGGESGE